MTPFSRLVGFAELSLATGKSVTALSTAASRAKLPLTVYRVGHIVTFDGDEVAAWVAAGYPTAADWDTPSARCGTDTAGPYAVTSKLKPDFSRPGQAPA